MLRLALFAALAALIAAPSAAAWTWPSSGPVHREFVLAANPYAGGQHRGIDVGGAAGADVAAPAGGTVSFAGTVGANGRTVTIQTADGYVVTLTHLGTIGVLRGVVVAEGATVGTIGPSGTPEVDVPYVHLGVRLAASDDSYVDPLALLPARAAPEAPAPAPAAPEPPAAAVVDPEQQRPSVAAVRDLPDAGTPFDAPETPEPPAAPEVPAAVPEVAAAPPAPAPEAAVEAPPAEDGDVLVKERYEIPAVTATRRAEAPQVVRGTRLSTATRKPIAVLPEARPVSSRVPAVDPPARRASRPHVTAPAPLTRVRPTPSVPLAQPAPAAVPRDANRPPVAAPFAPHDSTPVSSAKHVRSWRPRTRDVLLATLLCLAAVVAATGRRWAARIIGGFARAEERAAHEHERTEDLGRGGVAVCERAAPHRPRGGVRRPVGHLRAVPPAARQPRAHGQRDRRARDARDGDRGSGRSLAA